jgi:hypothetical protein
MEMDFINEEVKTKIKKKININSKIFENDPDGDAKKDYLLA